jgi:hypothetical protein
LLFYNNKMGHLDDVRMSYITHLKHSLYYSFESCSSGIIFFIHGLYPDIFVTAGSTKISNLNKRIANDSNTKAI